MRVLVVVVVMIVRKISYVTSVANPCYFAWSPGSEPVGCEEPGEEGEWAESTACIWWVFKTLIPGINTEWKQKREIISLHSVGSLNDLYIYFTNK